MLVLGALCEKHSRNPRADSFCVSLVCKKTVSVQECLSRDAAVRVEMERRPKLQSLCETRWASRADSLYTFSTSFPVVVQALESLVEDGDNKARGYVTLHPALRLFNCTICNRACPFKYSRTIHHAPRSIY